MILPLDTLNMLKLTWTLKMKLAISGQVPNIDAEGNTVGRCWEF